MALWLSEQLGRSEAMELPHVGRVTRVNGSCVDIESHMRLSGVRCVSGFGAGEVPLPGEEVLILPGMDGYYCVGRLSPAIFNK